MTNNRSQQKPVRGLRSSEEKSTRDSWVVSKTLKDILTLILFLNFLNILGYNTGWIDWKVDTFDIIWATGLSVVNLIYPIIFNSVSK